MNSTTSIATACLVSACLLALAVPPAAAETCLVQFEATDQQVAGARVRSDPSSICFDAERPQERVSVGLHGGIHAEGSNIYGWAQGYISFSLTSAGPRVEDGSLRGDACPLPGAECVRFELP